MLLYTCPHAPIYVLGYSQVPPGMGWGLPVTVGLVGGKQASVENKFSYEAPVVDSYHPRNGPPRGGFWITITGRNFGHLDTSPVVSLAGVRILPNTCPHATKYVSAYY
jgi:hypothetical protein